MWPASHRASYTEKRHTKPCKFFQKGVCPLSAERCDFAHVKIQILPVKYSYSLCQSFHAGRCDHGESVQLTPSMVHIEAGLQKVATPHATSEFESYSTASEDVSASTAQTAFAHASPTLQMWSYEAALPSPASARVPPASVSSPASVVSPEDLTQLIFRRGEDSPTSDVPSLSDGESEPPSAACDAPDIAERWPGTPATPTPMMYYIHAPAAAFSPGPFPPVPYGPWPVRELGTPRPESRKSGMSGRKLKAFKTKPCKFFKKDGRCPQGGLCTFIHDPTSVRSPITPSSYSPSPSNSSGFPPTLPQRPLSKEDEERARNIYPITWRVIGGGVMMGGRKVCKRFLDGDCLEGDDCPYVHPEEGLIPAAQTPSEMAFSPSATPRAATFSDEQTRVTAEKNRKQLTVAIPPLPELVPDVSPIVLRGRGPRGSLRAREDLPARPFSTPPRVSSRAEAFHLEKTNRLRHPLHRPDHPPSSSGRPLFPLRLAHHI
ncbi:hypothetical protein BC834DRAFT_583473 [Gloeopeniophorella convolvens]|nr:hypothetical protein BC834DRAFT_583473 [Gloeopeniophorella convolvens]